MWLQIGNRELQFRKTPSEQFGQRNYRHCQEKPQHRKGQTYLSVNIEHQTGIIPYVPAEPQIYDAAGNEFKGGYYYCPEQAFHKHRLMRTGRKTPVKYHKAQPAGHGHAPVSEAAENDFYKRIKYPAEKKKDKIFNSFWHWSYLRKIIFQRLFSAEKFVLFKGSYVKIK